MKPPTANELVGQPPLCLDEEWALKNFLGKTQVEAEEMYRTIGESLTEDFTYMAAAGLCYYLPPALSYLESDQSKGDYGFAHSLMCALSSQVVHHGMRGEALVLIKQIAEHCDTHREKFFVVDGVGVDNLFVEYLQEIRSA